MKATLLVVFLDFDGVINHGHGPWLKHLVERLNQITDRTGAKIVVHSSWRWGRTLDQIRVVLTHRNYHKGVPVTGEILDVCPSPLHYQMKPSGLWVSDGDFAAFKGDIETNDERAIAIQKWLDAHPGQVKNHVILDDSPNLGHFVGSKGFIQTQTRVGLTDAHVSRAILHLKGVTW